MSYIKARVVRSQQDPDLLSLRVWSDVKGRFAATELKEAWTLALWELGLKPGSDVLIQFLKVDEE